MKLLYLSASYIPSQSANSVHVMKMCNAISGLGLDVTLLARKGDKSLSENLPFYYGVENNFKVHRFASINLPGVSFLSSFLYLKDILKAKSASALVYGRDIPSLLLCVIFRVPFVYESHGLPQKRLLIWMEKKLIASRSLRGLVFISKALKSLYGLLPANIETLVMHDSADEPKSHDDKIELLGNSKFNVVYLGALYEGRGIELIYELAMEFQDVSFHLFGGSSSEVANQVTRARAMNLSNVHFYGYVSPGIAYKARNSGDVLLMPYQKKVMTINNASETSRYMSPLKMFEYMSSRKPIISSDHDVLKEVLVDGQNALLRNPQDVNSWKKALSDLKNDGDLRQRLSDSAYQDFLENYTWRNRARIIVEKFSDNDELHDLNQA